MTVQVDLPDDLIKQIDDVAADRSAFVAEAVKRMLRDAGETAADEVERIIAIAEELNREAEDVLEYQVISPAKLSELNRALTVALDLSRDEAVS